MPASDAERMRLGAHARLPGHRRGQRPRAARHHPRPPPGHGAGHPRAAVLPAAARGVRGRRRGAPAPARRGRGPVERVRVLRRAAHPRRGPRADSRAEPFVAPDAADPAVAPRLALREPRSGSRAAQRAQPPRRRRPVRRAHPHVPRVARTRPAGSATSSARPGSRPTSCSATPIWSPGFPDPARLATRPRVDAGRVGDHRPRVAGRARRAAAAPFVAGRIATCSG